MWHLLAFRYQMPLQQFQRSVTSSEFVELQLVVEEADWDRHSKFDYYLAQLVAEVRAFREAFSKDPKPVSTEDCLIKFGRGTTPTVGSPHQNGHLPGEVSTRGRKRIEVGVDELDPAWAKVNQSAKSVWAARLGIPISNG